MILLDTNAVLWLLTNHERAKPLLELPLPLYLSPISLLELKFLLEVGRLKLGSDSTLQDIANDSRWTLDNPSLYSVTLAALDIDWTQDPFDRLLVAHANARRWKLATGDRQLKVKLGRERVLEL
jgi:PIN domain nuclease of toxin-antitoxin system